MSQRSEDEFESDLVRDERATLNAIRTARNLSDLVEITGTDTEHEAYFSAKHLWYELRDKELSGHPIQRGFPGDCLVINEKTVCVHGVTHSNTDAERTYLRDHISAIIEAGGTVYCEQGIRSMYFRDYPSVCGMDDYQWAMQVCRERTDDSHLAEYTHLGFRGVTENLDSMTTRLRDVVYALIESGRDEYGEEFRTVLGDIASDFLMSHEDLATGDDFESFSINRQAAENPEKLRELQQYYKKIFLPQPLEREWLARHDPELEILTHARNERMADYLIYHLEEANEAHVIVGAAHQPGLLFYLSEYRDGDRVLEGFEPYG